MVVRLCRLDDYGSDGGYACIVASCSEKIVSNMPGVHV